MRKLLLIFLFVSGLVAQASAQDRTVSGKVSSSEDDSTLPGVTVVLKGTTTGTTTDLDGNYKLSVPSEGGILVYSFVGLATQEVEIGARSVIDLVMQPDAEQLNEVVVTALGISREKASLGYSVQEVDGSDVSTAKEGSFISSLSGRVSGLQIKKSNSIGGSVNAVIRGSNSFTGNNQALFVVDGIPISNSNLNTSTQTRGGGGYDYGNAASDIDPETIESISVLKGATAAALYGSDAANGVIMITTKKGSRKQNGIGVNVNHSTTFSTIDRSTFPKYQTEYGQGYGPYYGSTGGFYDEDIDGDGVKDELVVPAGEDASFGAAYDPNLMVYQWDSFYPELDTYQQPSPWVAPKDGADYIFQTGVANITSVNLQGGSELGTVRLGYTHDDRTGILPNSQITKNIIDFNATMNLSDKLSIDGKATYSRIEGRGRYGTGYDGKNVVQGVRQWFGTNVDMRQQEQAYESTGKNITWNPNGTGDTRPHYFDNPFFVFNENYETDKRNRFFGKFQANYQITDWLKAMARFGVDSYSDLQEERMAVGSLDQAEYEKYQRTFEEYNNDFMLSFDKTFDKLSVRGLVGFSIKDRKIISSRAETNGGLVIPGVYSLSNSASALEPPVEQDIHVKKYGYYGQLSLGYQGMLYLDATARVDQSSTLPSDHNTYLYPSVSGSFVFSELVDVPALSFGKVRLGFASVRGDAPSYSVANTYQAATPLDGVPMFYVGGNDLIADTSNNPDLKPEKTDELELGLELKFLDNRVGADISLYKKNTVDQILPVQISSASGFNYKYVNAGEMENKGIELSIFAEPVRTGDFSWRINANWATNRNKVVSLYEDGENLLIFSAWSTAINARKGEAYGSITGTDFVYQDGQRVVGSDGKYLMTESTNEILGNIQPDWTGGINNTFSYKGLSFGFLIDMQKGGDIISYDMGFGLATGLYAETAGLNDLGNPLRDPVTGDDTSGGMLLSGVKADGSPNDVRAAAGTYTNPQGFYGGSRDTGGSLADAGLLYDASYVKLREMSLTYNLPSSMLDNLFISKVSVGVFGRNLWIIHKNLPHSDPEYNTSSGNRQGIQNGALPSTREFGFNVNFQF
ncbi:SusC/RagA family TonB-linked outer membrane protein [Reichenbachiella carrageenanivorans]|uniref:SusC/RagA family TonB-linked outer membrane protein n=1 Tax=Reichenbachiella carrageenanivorans TaxID=2979869 RepID=A0ABY6D086_9BACT|nr:SusC/RagA family TonB-linked outer membrane protein [Reichenbachiella carrageenanivorans]UXX79567.1 SusC/RagA family TonB-linked outer membrane protein [Reichenbachiella carrageenanivorans]